MKYIIVAKGTHNHNSGNGSRNVGTPTSQTEAGTELIINRFAVINLLKQGVINEDTIVVTLPEREFLYTHIFKNVEIYDPNKIYEDCIDLVNDNNWEYHPDAYKWAYNGISTILPYKPFYQNFERDKNEILNIHYNQDILNKDLPPFLIVVARFKNSDTRRNLDKQYWADFLEESVKKYDKVFVFGKASDDLGGDKIEYIDTLWDYCSYLHHPNCKSVVSTLCGVCNHVQFFGNTNNDTVVTMMDTDGLIAKHGNDISYFNPAINFTNVKYKFINSVPEPLYLLESLFTN